MVSEDGLIILLARIESLAGDLARAKALNQRQDKLNEEIRDAHRARLRAEDKINEWAEYASRLRAAISAVAPTARRKTIVLPPMPKSLETEIPF